MTKRAPPDSRDATDEWTAKVLSNMNRMSEDEAYRQHIVRLSHGDEDAWRKHRGDAPIDGTSEQDQIRHERWQRFMTTIDDQNMREYMESCRDVFEPMMDDDPAAVEYETMRAERTVAMEYVKSRTPGGIDLSEPGNDFVAGRISSTELAAEIYRLVLSVYPPQGTA